MGQHRFLLDIMTLEEIDTKITESAKHLGMGEGVCPTKGKAGGAAPGHP